MAAGRGPNQPAWLVEVPQALRGANGKRATRLTCETQVPWNACPGSAQGGAFERRYVDMGRLACLPVLVVAAYSTGTTYASGGRCH